MDLPPGLGFHPTDRELITHYLRRKVEGLPSTKLAQAEVIPELNIYKHEPWDLREKSSLVARSHMKWYFITPLEKKSVNGNRTNRATETGYWRATGKDREVKEKGRIVGMKKTLVFYRGRAPVGERTNFVTHEYRLYEEMHTSQDFVVCKVMDKSGLRMACNGVPSTDVDDGIDTGPGKRFLEPGTTSASVLEPSPEEKPKVAGIDESPVSAPSFSVGGEACDDSELLGNLSPLTDAIFQLETLESNEKNLSGSAGASYRAADTPSRVMGQFDMSDVQEIQQKEANEFWDQFLTDDVIESVRRDFDGRM